MGRVAILCNGSPAAAREVAPGRWLCLGCGEAVKVVPPDPVFLFGDVRAQVLGGRLDGLDLDVVSARLTVAPR